MRIVEGAQSKSSAIARVEVLHGHNYCGEALGVETEKRKETTHYIDAGQIAIFATSMMCPTVIHRKNGSSLKCFDIPLCNALVLTSSEPISRYSEVSGVSFWGSRSMISSSLAMEQIKYGTVFTAFSWVISGT